MDFITDPADVAFRAEVGRFFDEFAGSQRGLSQRDREQALGRAMADRGMVGVRLAGGGTLEPTLNATQALIIAEEALRCGVDLNFVTGNMFVAKTLAVIGTPQQRTEILPKVARGEVRIALGYTEPDTGSDIAAARTRAV